MVGKYKSKKIFGVSRSDSMKLSHSISIYPVGDVIIFIDKEFAGIETYPLSNKSFQQNSGSAESEYLIRVVTDVESFVEKVQIVSAGYDDRAIELMKFTNSPLEEGDIQFNYEHMFSPGVDMKVINLCLSITRLQ